MKAFDADRRRLWCHGPKPEYEMDEDWADQWYISARTVALVRPKEDFIVLPGGNKQTREFFKFCEEILEFEKGQAIWTSGESYLLDHDIVREVLPEVKTKTREGSWEIIPYSVTRPFLSWARKVQHPIFGDEEKWVSRYSNKAFLHPHIRPRLRDRGLPILEEVVPWVRVPRGYTCHNVQDLLTASQRLHEEGVRPGFVVKPTRGTTGEGIMFAEEENTLLTYTFPMGPVVLEERLRVDTNRREEKIAPSIQYFGGALSEEVTDQLFGGGVAHEGNLVPSRTRHGFQKELRTSAQHLLDWLDPKGPGGFDFLSVDGKPVLVDPNVGRFTGAHPAFIFRKLYAPASSVQCSKTHPKGTVWDLWERLQRKGIAFKPYASDPGVFPLCHLPGMWGV